MNIDGVNTLACTLACSDLRSKEVRIYPLPHMPVVKDLIPDLTQFYEQYAAVKPWLVTRSPAPAEWRAPAVQGRTGKDRPAIRVHTLRLLFHFLPQLLVEFRPLPGTRGAAGGISLDHRQS